MNISVGELVDVDPATLVIGRNVRVTTHPDARDFAASIKERGVIEVITAYRDDSDNLVVLRGQRRAVVAAEVGTPTGTVAVRVVPEPGQADRITDQVTENIHRAGMSEAEVRDAIGQLVLCGVSAAQITKRTALPRATVNAAVTVTRNGATRARMDEVGLTLEQAAVFAEFEGDDAAITTLTAALRSWQPLEHVAQRLRDAAAETALLRAEAQRLRDEGLPALDPSDIPDMLSRVMLANLVTDDGEPVPEADWPQVIGAAIAVQHVWRRQPIEAAAQVTAPATSKPDSDTAAAEKGGDPQDDIRDDEWDEEGDEQGDPSDDGGGGGGGGGRAVRVVVPVWICLDPLAAGLSYRYEVTRRGSDRHGPEPLSDEDESAQREARRVERRRVIDNNKAWRSAETVRRDWLRGFLTRNTPPAGAEAIVCEALILADYSLAKAMEQQHPMLLALLGLRASATAGSRDLRESLAARPVTPKAAAMLSLASVVASWEQGTSTNSWRNPTAWDARIMAALIRWGYRASDVEKLLIGEAIAPATVFPVTHEPGASAINSASDEQ